ncbi:uncharacterized protein DUF4214 [Pseudoduganella lurida]|uniref:Uncharacterized protein DUF4214 n=1 Tax=Pseudoduganella lurida TaxID=1036180 RepID=A0A562RFC4_9BURK|nr:DUF4214 domain-containing protein [Pseudoduganella lurida]TWI67752.1 uncharacterized protein DUF4214 [Pseudoduganella lurida]
MVYETIPDLPLLGYADMNGADRLRFGPHLEDDGYENEAVFAANDFHANPVFRFTAVGGALYTVTADSHFDPYHLVLYDDYGYPIAEDDGWGPVGQDGLSFIAPYSGTYYVDASWAQHSLDAAVSLAVLEDLDTIPVQVGNGTAGDDAITGTASNDALYGQAGNDLLEGRGGNDLLDGGSGLDTAWYEGRLDEYDVTTTGHRRYVTDLVGLDGSDTLVNIERIDFADVALAFDVDGTAGAAFRLYRVFDRAPDEAGLGFWIAQLDAGASLRSVAQGFTASAEFAALYGTNPDNQTLVTGFYEHILHRAPDAGGLAFWMDTLATGRDSVAGVLTAFTESAENYAQLIGVMEEGMAYQVPA